MGLGGWGTGVGEILYADEAKARQTDGDGCQQGGFAGDCRFGKDEGLGAES